MSYGRDLWTGEAPRNVLSPETIAAALAGASRSAPSSSNRSQTYTQYSSSSASRSSYGTKSSFVPKHENCFCIDCRDPADRDRLGTLSRNRDGDKVLELDSDESVPLGIHCAPGQWRDDSSFGGSSSRGGRSSSSYGGAGAGSGRQGQGRGYGYAQIRQSAMRSYTRDSNGDSIEEYGGAGTPDVYVHLNPNDPSHRNLRDDEYAYYRR